MGGRVLPFPARPAPAAGPGLQPRRFEPSPLRRDREAHPELTRRLDQGLSQKATLLVAPCGWGKSTALAEWRAQTSWPTGWLSVEAEGEYGVRFVVHLCAALYRARPELARPLEGLLWLPPTADLTAILAEYLVAPLAKSGARAALIIDDYDRVAEIEPIKEAMNWLLDHMPSGLHLVVSSGVPAVFDVRGRPPRRDILSLRLAQDADEALQADLHLSKLRSGALDALAPLAIVNRVCDALAEHLLQGGTAPESLEAWADRSPLINREGPHSAWYVLHPTLRAHLRSRLDPEQVAPLHARAAQWLAEREDVGEAVRHLRAAGQGAFDGVDVVALAESCLRRGDQFTLKSLLQSWQPADHDAERWALIEGRRLLASQAPMRAQALLRTIEASVDGEVAAERALAALACGPCEVADHEAERAMQEAPAGTRAWATARLVRGVRCVDRAEARMGRRLLRDAFRVADGAGYGVLALTALAVEVDLLRAQGDLVGARATLEEGEAVLDRCGLRGAPVEATLGLRWALLHLADGEWLSALRVAERSLDLLDPLIIAPERPPLRRVIVTACLHLPRAPRASLEGLPRRAAGALQALSVGGASRDVARRLGIAVGSAILYLNEALDQLNAGGRTEALLALQAQ